MLPSSRKQRSKMDFLKAFNIIHIYALTPKELTVSPGAHPTIVDYDKS